MQNINYSVESNMKHISRFLFKCKHSKWIM